MKHYTDKEMTEETWNKFVFFALGEDNGYATGFRIRALLNYMNNDTISDSTKGLLTYLMINGIENPELRSQMMKAMKEVAREITTAGKPIYGHRYTGPKYQSWDDWKDNNMTDKWKALITDFKAAEDDLKNMTDKWNRLIDIESEKFMVIRVKLKAHENKLKELYNEEKTEYMKKQTDKAKQESLDKWSEEFDN